VSPLDGAAGDLGAAVINSKKRQWWAPLGGGVRDLGVPTINDRNIDDGPLGPHRGAFSIQDLKGVL
jgi:hypothetical protein